MMAQADLSAVAVAAMQLQNGYAQAIDMRDWDRFRTFFTPDVLAEYPGNRCEGMDAWLDDFFIPFHDGCSWTLHMVLTHAVGEDSDGVWASSYGFTRWILKAEPEVVQNAQVLFRDRLVEQGGSWLISRRRLDVLTIHPMPMAEGESFPASILDVVSTTTW
jgi:hypothetical protein